MKTMIKNRQIPLLIINLVLSTLDILLISFLRYSRESFPSKNPELASNPIFIITLPIWFIKPERFSLESFRKYFL